MENLPNNFPKKIYSQDNQVEKSEGRIIKNIEIKVGENTYSLETESYDFEYPKNIQEETGILGYERTKINKESISNILESNESISEDFIVEVLKSLSHGEYPQRTYNHRMGGYANAKLGALMPSEFKDDKFFIQKIYDKDRINKKRADLDVSKIYNHHAGDEDYSIAYSNMSFFKKDTLENVTKGSRSTHVGNIPDYDKEINEGEVFGATPHGGLNFIGGGFFNRVSIKELSIGFPMKLDSFQKEYFEKALDIFLELSKKNSSREGEIQWGLLNVINILLLNNILEDNSILQKVKDNIYPFGRSPIGIPKEEALIFFRENILKNFLETYPNTPSLSGEVRGFDIESWLFYQVNSVLRKSVADEYTWYTGNTNEETFMSVFIGNDDIPQLAWGHARYAHYTNEKNFNFFKFKHADHLPIKKETHTSES